jgi:hypothetical protein
MIDWQTDIYRPTASTDLLGFDNYEIYDVVTGEMEEKETNYVGYRPVQKTTWINSDAHLEHYPGLNAYPYPDFFGSPTHFVNRMINGVLTPVFAPETEDPLQDGISWLTYSTYVLNHSTFIRRTGYHIKSIQNWPSALYNLGTVTRTVGINAFYAVQRWTPQGESNSDLIYTLFDEYPPLIGSTKIIWNSLIIAREIKYSGVAQVSGVYYFEYFGLDPYESHPKITHTLNYYKVKIRLEKGKRFNFKLLYPVAHTLVISPQLSAATPPLNEIALGEILASNRNYANTIPSRPAPVSKAIDLSPIYYTYSRESYDQYRGEYYPYTDSNGETQFAIGYRQDPAIQWEDPNHPAYQVGWREDVYTWTGYKVLRASNQVKKSTFATTAVAGEFAQSFATIYDWHFAPQP